MRLAAVLLAGACWAANLKVISPPGATVVGPYSPGIMAGDFLYVSGQGAARKDGTFASATAQQVEDTLKNIQSIVEAAGLTMEHVVYMQVYLSDMRGEAEADAAWKKFFPKSAPARAILGVFRMPTNTPVEINAVAVRDLAMKKVVAGGVLAGDRLYISGTTGGGTSGDAETHVASALAEMKRTLAASGMDFANVVFMNPYLTDKMPMDVMNRVYAKHFEHGNTPARATIRVHSLPAGASVAFTGVAVRDLAKRLAVRPKNMAPSPTASPCVWAGDTYYCSAKAGFIPGPNGGIYATTVEHQVRQTMRNLLDGLEEAGLSFDNVVATNVYLDNLDEFGKMNAVYAEYFRNVKPTRTTVQPLPPTERIADGRGRYPKLEEISLVAVK